MFKKKAFTLVELSIVLIIIGLLSGFILKGQDVIRNAKLKRVMSDYLNISTALYTYEDRYDQLPGDDASSVIARSLKKLGNEDGVIDVKESSMVLRHLRKAGIIAGDGDDNVLSHSLNGKIFVSQGILSADVSKLSTSSMPHMSGVAVCFDNVKVEDAQLLDAQNDDGRFNQGTLQASHAYSKEDSMMTICIEI